MGNFISYSLPALHWGNGFWATTFLPRLNNYKLEHQNLGHPGNLAVFVRAMLDRLRLNLEPRYPLPCKLTPLHHPVDVRHLSSRPVEPGASFSFELTENRGAALVTKYQTYRIDAMVESAFERYTKRHYESWVNFARDKEYGNDVHPFLVSGFDVTKDFAMVAYSDDSASLGAELAVAVPVIASASASLWGTWRTRCSPHTNSGPQDYRLLPDEQAIESSSSSRPTEAAGIPNQFNQCVFIRYYTMRSRGPFALFPKVIRAGAGYHDLGSGDNRGDAFPELTVQSDAETTASGDEDFGQLWSPTMDDFGSEADVVVRNTPHVRFLRYPLVHSLTSLRMRDTTAWTLSQTTYSR